MKQSSIVIATTKYLQRRKRVQRGIQFCHDSIESLNCEYFFLLRSKRTFAGCAISWHRQSTTHQYLWIEIGFLLIVRNGKPIGAEWVEDLPMLIGRLIPLYFRQELITVQVTFLPSRSAHRLSSNETSFDSESNVVVASTTATGRDLCEKSKFYIKIRNNSLCPLSALT